MHTLWLRLLAMSNTYCWTEHDFVVDLQNVCPWITIRVGQEVLGICCRVIILGLCFRGATGVPGSQSLGG